MSRWKPNVTVATVIERKNTLNEVEYLLVHEIRDGKKVYNQPAGHLDEGESLAEAAIRETLEETGWDIALTGVVGIYRFIGNNNTTYLRHVFSANVTTYHSEQVLDDGIIEAVWMTYDQVINAIAGSLRSHLVKQAIDDYEKSTLYPLSLLHEPNESR